MERIRRSSIFIREMALLFPYFDLVSVILIFIHKIILVDKKKVGKQTTPVLTCFNDNVTCVHLVKTALQTSGTHVSRYCISL